MDAIDQNKLQVNCFDCSFRSCQTNSTSYYLGFYFDCVCTNFTSVICCLAQALRGYLIKYCLETCLICYTDFLTSSPWVVRICSEQLANHLVVPMLI